MRESNGRLALGTVPWGVAGGFITLAAGLAGLSWGERLNRTQIVLVVVASALSAIYSTYFLLKARRSDRKLDAVGVQVDNVGTQITGNTEVLTRIDARDHDSTLVLLGGILKICTEEAVRVAIGTSSYDVLVQKSVESLHATLMRGHGTDATSLRVGVLLYEQHSRLNGQHPAAKVICYPKERGLEIVLTDEAADHVAILMSRRHPYQNGWHRWTNDGVQPGPEGHILQPEDRNIVSYIRVGIPGIGVLLVDSWEKPCSIAERRFAVAVADVLGLPYQRSAALPIDVQRDAIAAVIMEGTEST